MHSATVHHIGRHAIAPADDRWIGVAEVARITDRHRVTIYRMIAAGDFPRGELRRNRRCWWLSEVLAWMDRDTSTSPP